MKPSLLARHRRLVYTLALSLALTAVGIAAYWHANSAPDAPPEDPSAAMLQALERSTDAWTANRRDLSTLVGDMRNERIASAALSTHGIYVSTVDGQHYWLADQSGRIGETILRDYASGARLFPVALFDTDGERRWYDVALGQWPFLLLLLAALGFGAWQLRPYPTLKQGTGVRFADVIGASEAKLALQDVTAYLRDPVAFAALGARPPKGVLLTGEPGTGKTQLAKALASECEATFIQVSGSDFSSMYFGVGIQKVKSLFRNARKHAPCIIFIDEIDGIGRRSETSRSSDAEGNRIVNQFLTELDGFAADSGVLILGATNFPNSLDPALVREGRFDRSIAVGLPSLAEREQLFRLYAGKIKACAEVDHPQLARNSVGLTPAAIAYIVNHAALLAARSLRGEVLMQDFVDALETCRIGEQPVGASALSASERTRIAVHEAGHAIVAAALNCGRVEKVTILPRGQALGVTLVTPAEDKRLHLQSELRARIQMLLAGRVAEQLHFHEVSSGAGQDLHEASKIALSMVGALGMGPTGSLLSLQAVRDAHLESDPRAALQAADELLQQLEGECLKLLQRLKPALDRISARLLEEETVAGEEVLAAVAALHLEPQEHSNFRPGHARHLERVAASSYALDPLFDLAVDEEEPAQPGPGMA